VTATADLDDSLIFVKVAQFECLSRAAGSFGMPISTVSPRLSVLISNLGVSLPTTTTQRLTLTAQVSVRIARKVTLGGARVAALTHWMHGADPLVETLSLRARGHPLLGVV
jgi:DNA-binding transcriptional LysR family regulator